MRAYFFKYQLYYALISLIFFSHAIFYYYQNSHLEKTATLSKQLITDISCSVAPRSKSSIKVIKNDRVYSVDLPSERCLKLNKGEKILLYYNEKYDYYYLPGALRIHLIRVIVTGSILILLVLPWKFFPKIRNQLLASKQEKSNL